MEDYLKGYLEVLPVYQRQKVEEIIRGNQDLYQFQNMDENQFREIMDRLAEDHEQLTAFIPQVDKLDPELHNMFYSNLHVDLQSMFLESELIEMAIANYDRIFDGIIGDLQKDIRALRERVNSLRLVSDGEDGLIVRSYDFDTKEQMETDMDAYAHLFKDRDGSSNLPLAVIERNHDQYYITLSKNQEMDLLRDKNGKTTASIQVMDRRGVPVKHENASKYSLSKAIDGTSDSYWAEVVLTDEPINIGMNK